MSKIFTVFILVLSLTATGYAQDNFQKAEMAYKAKNYTEAFQLYKVDAELGHPESQERLGYMFRKGRGVAKNKVEAEQWYDKAAKQGLVKAQTELAYLLFAKKGISSWSLKTGKKYENGYRYTTKGSDQDKVDAYFWVNLAASKSKMLQNPKAKMLRADMRNSTKISTLFKGERKLLPLRDHPELIELNRLADGGDMVAQLTLAKMYSKGERVMKHYGMAYHWAYLAQHNGMEKEGKKVAKNACGKLKKNDEILGNLGQDYLLIEYFEKHPKAFVKANLLRMIRDVCSR